MRMYHIPGPGFYAVVGKLYGGLTVYMNEVMLCKMVRSITSIRKGVYIVFFSFDQGQGSITSPESRL
jgi:sulfite exporter TauE/SafE